MAGGSSPIFVNAQRSLLAIQKSIMARRYDSSDDLLTFVSFCSLSLFMEPRGTGQRASKVPRRFLASSSLRTSSFFFLVLCITRLLFLRDSHTLRVQQAVRQSYIYQSIVENKHSMSKFWFLSVSSGITRMSCLSCKISST
jgi:hypothetical protein